MRTHLKIIPVIILVFFFIACGKSDTEKAEALIAAGKFNQAIGLLTRPVAEKPEDAEIQFLFGVALINHGQLPEGEERFADAVSLNSDYGSRIGREYKKAGDYALKEDRTAEAIRLYRAAVRHQPDLNENVGRSLYEKGKDLSLAGKNAQAIELHQYAMAHDPLLGEDIGKWYAVKAAKTISASERANLLKAASHFKTAYRQEAEKIQQAAAREAAEKKAMSVRARMKHVIEQRLDESAWQRLAVKGMKTLGTDETVDWSARYYRKAGHEIRRLTLNDKEWVTIERVANRSIMFFLSANDFWYLKSSLTQPQVIRAAITKAKGVQFRGDDYMDIALKTETPPQDVFYWTATQP